MLPNASGQNVGGLQGILDVFMPKMLSARIENTLGQKAFRCLPSRVTTTYRERDGQKGLSFCPSPSL